MNLDFDPATHTYSVGGIEVPSVTQLLDLYWSDGAKPFYTEETAARGRAVHRMTVEIDSGQEPWMGSPDWTAELEGYLNAYQSFLEEKQPAYLMTEAKVFHAKYWYAGTLDRFGVMDDQEGPFDFKTGKSKIQHCLQLAGYAMALNPSDPPRTGWIVELNDTGKYRCNRYPLDDELVAWQGLVRYHRYRRRYGT